MPRFGDYPDYTRLTEKRDRREKIEILSLGSGLFLLGLCLGVGLPRLLSNNPSFLIYLLVPVIAYSGFTWYVNAVYQLLTRYGTRREHPTVVKLITVIADLPRAAGEGLIQTIVWPYFMLRWINKGSIRIRDYTRIIERRRILRTPFFP